jgi:hypothetical protein
MPYPVEITGGQSFGERQGLDLSLYRILQILSVTVFEKICILGGQLQRGVPGRRVLYAIEPIRLLMGRL